jgi:hypothetical protein
VVTEKKLAASLQNLKKAAEANAARRAFAIWTCATCGAERPATVHQRRKTYCSKACMVIGYSSRLRGPSNPNYRAIPPRKCERCGKGYESYNKERKYCTHECYRLSVSYRSRVRKDVNHDLIVEALEQMGVSVLDASKMGQGFPDLVLGVRGRNLLAEIKNPDNYYGRKGGSESQLQFAASWPAPIYLLFTVEDAERVACDRLHELRILGRVQ